MQTLVQGRKIDDDARKDAILGIISDKYCRAILDTTMDKPRSAMEISAESKIPISTVYRRLQTLHDNKLLRITGSISDDGKKYFMYRSKVKAVTSSYKGGFIEIEIVPNPVQLS
jgi:DNA-binding transcriptional ArsR family regulator